VHVSEPVHVSEQTRVQRLLSNPFFGFAPWIVMSVFEGPQRFELAAVLAFLCALTIGAVGAFVGMRPKLLDLAGILFFAPLIVVGLLVDESALRWLERWSGELSNVAIVLVALSTIALRRPFTLEYARETVDAKDRDSLMYMHINYTVAWVWTAVFLLTAIVGFIGDGPLHEPDNLWTNWLVQIALLILALRFTEWYPEAVGARQEIAAGERTEPAPSVRKLLLPLAGYAVPVGIVVLLVGGTPWWVGIGLIVLGVYLTRTFSEQDTGETAEPVSSGQL
jgi:hypothetical protein